LPIDEVGGVFPLRIIGDDEVVVVIAGPAAFSAGDCKGINANNKVKLIRKEIYEFGVFLIISSTFQLGF